ncbi:hypothetical protein [Microbacterium enclense]|uniref:hypothetical protein n=1 Tax=Microbacterium enclense TaxID=993073 RepID=UPI00342F6B49
MNDFTASNGLRIEVNRSDPSRVAVVNAGGHLESILTPDRMQALREFFQAEADERLGRWRWPENPDYVVYPVGVEIVDVLRESSVSKTTPGPGRQEGVTRAAAEEWDQGYSQNFFRAARAYFDAHPEPRPWTRAKEGESWYLTITSLGPETGLRWVAQGSPIRFWAGGLHISADSNEITDGRPVNAGMS